MTKHNHTTAVTVYRLARGGATDAEICRVLGIGTDTMVRWKQELPDVAYALEEARQQNGKEAETFTDYVYGWLSPEARAVWDELCWAEDQPDAPERVEDLLRNHGRVFRQRMFVHALVHTTFNASRACRMVGINFTTYRAWMRQAPFRTLIDEVRWHRDNFFENALMDQVAKGETAAILHVAKTKLRHRGYGTHVEVEAKVTNQQPELDFGDLDLPLETQREILEAIRRKREADEGVVEGHLVAPEEVPEL